MSEEKGATVDYTGYNEAYGDVSVSGKKNWQTKPMFRWGGLDHVRCIAEEKSVHQKDQYPEVRQ